MSNPIGGKGPENYEYLDYTIASQEKVNLAKVNSDAYDKGITESLIVEEKTKGIAGKAFDGLKSFLRIGGERWSPTKLVVISSATMMGGGALVGGAIGAAVVGLGTLGLGTAVGAGAGAAIGAGIGAGLAGLINVSVIGLATAVDKVRERLSQARTERGGLYLDENKEEIKKGERVREYSTEAPSVGLKVANKAKDIMKKIAENYKRIQIGGGAVGGAALGAGIGGLIAAPTGVGVPVGMLVGGVIGGMTGSVVGMLSWAFTEILLGKKTDQLEQGVERSLFDKIDMEETEEPLKKKMPGVNYNSVQDQLNKEFEAKNKDKKFDNDNFTDSYSKLKDE